MSTPPPAHREPTSAVITTAGRLWPEVLRLAAASRRLRALVDGLTLVAFEDGRVELSAQPALTALARSSAKELEELVTKAAGGPIALTIRVPDGPVACEKRPEAGAAPGADIRQHPLVKAAEELFGAHVVRVESKPR